MRQCTPPILLLTRMTPAPTVTWKDILDLQSESFPTRRLFHVATTIRTACHDAHTRLQGEGTGLCTETEALSTVCFVCAASIRLIHTVAYHPADDEHLHYAWDGETPVMIRTSSVDLDIQYEQIRHLWTDVYRDQRINWRDTTSITTLPLPLRREYTQYGLAVISYLVGFLNKYLNTHYPCEPYRTKVKTFHRLLSCLASLSCTGEV